MGQNPRINELSDVCQFSLEILYCNSKPNFYPNPCTHTLSLYIYTHIYIHIHIHIYVYIHKPMPVRDDHLHMFRSQGRLSCAIGGRAFYAWAIFVEKLRYHSYRAGIHLLAGTQHFGLQGYQFRIRDPYNSCWLATNLSRIYTYNVCIYIYLHVYR